MFIFCKQNISKAWPIYAQYFQTGSLASTQVTNQEFLMLQTTKNFWTSDKQIVKRWYQAIHMYSLTLSESNLQLCWTCCIQIQFSCFMLFTEKKNCPLSTQLETIIWTKDVHEKKFAFILIEKLLKKVLKHLRRLERVFCQ